MIPLTKEEKIAHHIKKRCFIYKKKFSTDDKNKKKQSKRSLSLYWKILEVLLMISVI